MTARRVRVAAQAQGRELSFRALAGVVAAGLVAESAASPGNVRLVLALAIISLVVGVGLVAPKALLYGLLAWLVALGLLRRVVSLAFPSGRADPLLVVEVVAVAALVLAAGAYGHVGGRTVLGKATILLSVLMLAGALNPAQGSLGTGAAGLLFGLVPLGGFWIGRAFCDDRTYGRILRLAAVVGLGAAIYGLWQTFAGFPGWDRLWVQQAGYDALHVGGATRAFGNFASASEYAAFLAIAFVAWIGYGFRGARAWVGPPALVLLGVALWYESSRGVIFLVPIALVLMWAAKRRRPLAVSLLAAAAVVLLVPTVVSRLGPTGPASGDSSLVQHQLAGLANPLDRSSSTLALHATLVVNGLETAVWQPLGVGTGAVSIAGTKFGGENLNTEADPSNVAVALGLPGLLAYFVVLVAGFRRAYALAAARRDSTSLVALGVLVVMVLQWLNGGQYAVALLVWLTLGWLDGAFERQFPRFARAGGEADA